MNSSVVTKTRKYDNPLRMNGINAKYSTGSLMGTEEQTGHTSIATVIADKFEIGHQTLHD